MCFAPLTCAEAELQPFEADARAAALNNVLDLADFTHTYAADSYILRLYYI